MLLLSEIHLVVLGVISSLWLIYLSQKQLRRRSDAVLPPSPPSEWLVGHLRTLPPNCDHIYFANLSQELKSDIVSFTILGQTTVVLNSAAAASDLLEKRSAIYSDRPEIVVIADERLLDWRKGAVVCPFGPRHRAYRKMMHKTLSRDACKKYHAYQEAEIRGFTKRLLASTDEIEANFRQTVAGIIMRITYGYQVQTMNDHLIKLVVTTALNIGQAVLSSNYLVNTIPLLKYIPSWIPGAQWKRDMLGWREQKRTMVEELFRWPKRAMENGATEPCAVQTLLEDTRESGLNVEDAEDHIKNLAGTLFMAGIDTTITTFMTFVLAMVLFPDAQGKARAEIDRVVGPGRLPTMQDTRSLPYVSAVIREVIRWQPVTPFAVPHAVIQDDVYRGYMIPKGATVIGNVWAITRDPDVYPNPEAFDPDRFYNQPTPFAPGFGWGRRICPGQYAAEDTLLLAVASTLAAFTISKAKDEHGNEITPTTKKKENWLVYGPTPFKCKLEPRSDHYRSMVANT